ncbi:Uma2 family endonuclease [Streptomyces sp. Je 1-369]|uniref:Uma2 family endonuclease n=1 Tax=Streptomyces sp. Je 1-369 TaxID=2966192 RepID=UPI00228606E7|nr:Uma2 family endonuclease [Streptomyces sp. Je 1-369]WAL96250.1 Uma2 family endonuclease [Streptomyces sp. Je 1-369]
MTPSIEEHAQMTVEEFEHLEKHAPDAVKLEFIRGKLKVKPMPDQRHRAIVMWLLTQCMQQRPELLLYPEQDLKVEAYRNGRAYADGALAPVDHFVGQEGMWADTEGVLMVVGVTSKDSDTHLRDRVEKHDGYAAADVPVYLLVDRDKGALVVFSEPMNGAYQRCPTYPFGDTVRLPEPVNITLATEKLKDYAD